MGWKKKVQSARNEETVKKLKYLGALSQHFLSFKPTNEWQYHTPPHIDCRPLCHVGGYVGLQWEQFPLYIIWQPFFCIGPNYVFPQDAVIVPRCSSMSELFGFFQLSSTAPKVFHGSCSKAKACLLAIFHLNC